MSSLPLTTSTQTKLTSRPLQVRVGIRDHWDNKDAEVNKALNNLNQTVGYDMTLEIAWVDVWNELQDKFTDKTTFVAAISDAIKKYLIRIEKLLEDSEEFQNNYLEMMEAKRKALFIQIHDDSVPQTKFVNNLFTLFLPKGDSSTYRTITDRLGADLEDVFSGKVTNAPKAEPFQTMKDDFVEVLPSGATPSLPKVTSLPLVSNLPKPEALFPTLLPYTLIVRRTGNGIDIEGSHEPTLSLICEYFKRHSRKNLNLTTQVSLKRHTLPSQSLIFFNRALISLSN